MRFSTARATVRTGRLFAIVGWDNAGLLVNGLPHVFYFDETNRNLRHGWFG
ncbi:MAG: hypothetical protein M5U31_16410 [Acidimicrobiia bacterium]|nr:hypothetical protein [Acidimicrobiia bacterium]